MICDAMCRRLRDRRSEREPDRSDDGGQRAVGAQDRNLAAQDRVRLGGEGDVRPAIGGQPAQVEDLQRDANS